MDIDISFRVTEEAAKNFENLQKAAELKSMRELFDEMASIYWWIFEEIQRGRKIASIDEQANRYQVMYSPAMMAMEEKVEREVAAQNKQQRKTNSRRKAKSLGLRVLPGKKLPTQNS